MRSRRNARADGVAGRHIGVSNKTLTCAQALAKSHGCWCQIPRLRWMMNNAPASPCFPVFRFIGNLCKAIGNQRSINSSAIGNAGRLNAALTAPLHPGFQLTMSKALHLCRRWQRRRVLVLCLAGSRSSKEGNSPSFLGSRVCRPSLNGKWTARSNNSKRACPRAVLISGELEFATITLRTT